MANYALQNFNKYMGGQSNENNVNNSYNRILN